jgi:hypothetical protein
VHFQPAPWGRTEKPEIETAALGYADPSLDEERAAFGEFLRAEHAQRHEALEAGIIDEDQADHHDEGDGHHDDHDHEH